MNLDPSTLSIGAWLLLATAAFGIGITKSGFSGVSLVHVLIFAYVFGAKASTGIVLPMLIAGDTMAMLMFGQHADWRYVRRMFPPALLGVIAAWLLMDVMNESYYRPTIGCIILALAVMQLARKFKEAWFTHIPHSPWFAWVMGILVGITTMLANAAGPVYGLFLIAIGLPKKEFVGTAAWFFLLLNLIKIPFSWNLGLMNSDTLMINVILIPGISLGLLAGRAIADRIRQADFETAVLILATLAGLHMVAN
ncbi:MAG: sulfite exporter TauE/SafE family protein [Pirellula sp.]